MGVWATVAAAFSALNNIQPQMSSMARALRFTALYRMVPVPLLRRNWRRYNTPLPALICQGIVVGILMNFGFNVLVTINVREKGRRRSGCLALVTSIPAPCVGLVLQRGSCASVCGLSAHEIYGPGR